MKKISFYLTNTLFNSADAMIRKKSDILGLLFDTIPEILVESSLDMGLGECNITVDKMSRATYTLRRNGTIYKKFSIHFPFALKEILEGDKDLLIQNNWSIFDKEDQVVTSQILSVLKILNQEGAFDDKISANLELIDFHEQIVQACRDVDLEEKDNEKSIWRLTRYLSLYEPGYLRYDYDDDPERCDDVTHPLHHLDFYFSSNATLKIGIARNDSDYRHWKVDSFERLLDNSKPCFYLKLP